MCKIPSRSGITLRFGACPHLSVPVLCSLLFPKDRNNIARFHHQVRFIETPPVVISIHIEELGSLCCSIPFPLRRQNRRDPSHANFAVAELVMHPPGRWHCLQQMRASSSVRAFTRASNLSLHFLLFSPCPYCRKCLISQTENVSPTGKRLLLKE